MLWQARRGFISGRGAVDPAAGGGFGAHATAYLARTSGLDATYINAFGAYIDGLDADNLFSKFDVLYWYGHQDSTNAQLNLVSTSFNATIHGSPTFTADRGFTGVDGSTTVYIDPGFNPTTASSPKYVQNSAHISVWNLTNATNTNPAVGGKNGASSINTYLFPKYVDSNSYFRINNDGLTGSISGLSPVGHFLGNVSNSGTNGLQGYYNGGLVTTESKATSLPNFNLYSLGYNGAGTANGCGQQQLMFSLGSSLSSTDAANFYNRNRTLATALGVP